MRQLAVTWSELDDAVQLSNDEVVYYLDLENGGVLLVTSESESAWEQLQKKTGIRAEAPDEEWTRAMTAATMPAWQLTMIRETALVGADQEGRFVAVPRPQGREAYEFMVDFIATVADSQLRATLEDAIVGQGALRRFRELLGRHPEQQARWYAFEQQCRRRWLQDWLNELGIEPLAPPT